MTYLIVMVPILLFLVCGLSWLCGWRVDIRLRLHRRVVLRDWRTGERF